MRQLAESIKIRATRQAVWAVLADFGGVEKWAPGMRNCRIEGSRNSGIGARRHLRHAWGFGISETVTQWNEGFGLSFALTRAPYPMRNVLETWNILEMDGHCIARTTVSYGMRLNAIGAFADAALVRFLVSREMRAGIRGLKRYIELN